MWIKNLKLINYRNYNNLHIEFSPGINIFEGPNGAGKTNLIEAVSILGHIKSFRNTPDEKLITWDKNTYFCSAELKNGLFSKADIGYDKTRRRKQIRLDGKIIKRSGDFYGRIPMVIIAPDDYTISTGAPELRRRYIDSVLAKLDTGYYLLIQKYKTILFERNKLLKDIRKGIEKRLTLEPWNELLIKIGREIIGKRHKFVDEFSSYLNNNYRSISGDNEGAMLRYIPNCSPDILKERVLAEIEKDIHRGATGSGPHKDAINVLIDDRNAVDTASQGQKRTAVIAMKLAEKAMLEDFRNEPVILVIDDVISELDESRRNGLFEQISGENQVLFTMVSRKILTYSSSDLIKGFVIDNGSVDEIQS